MGKTCQMKVAKARNDNTALQQADSWIRRLFFATFGSIIILLLFFSSTDHFLKVDHRLSNGLMLVLGLVAASIGYLLFRILARLVDSHNAQLLHKLQGRWTVIFASVLLISVQLMIALSIMFKTGWDAGTVFDFAYKKVDNQLADYSRYFSLYPNNLFLAWLYVRIIRLHQTIFGSLSLHGCIFALIVLNSAVSGATAILVYRVIKLLTKSSLMAWLGWIGYALVVGFSPWFLIPYSDALGILFPILMLYLYTRPTRNESVRWMLIGACAYIGFRIKPTTAILLIAILSVELVASIGRMPDWRRVLRAAALFITTLVLLQASYALLMVPSLGLTLNKEKSMGPVHFIKMGLNDETDGVFLDEDVQFSESFESKGAQNAANFKVIKDRLDDFGFQGYGEFLTRKALVNFNNGSFGWGAEGSFVVMPVNRSTRATHHLMSYYYPFGEDHHLFLTVSQVLWLMVLFGAFLLGFNRKYPSLREQKIIAAIRLSLIGLVVYVMLFEARARYLYTFLPIFLVAALVGFQWFRAATGVHLVQWIRYTPPQKTKALPISDF